MRKITLQIKALILLFISVLLFYCNKLPVSPIIPVSYIEQSAFPQFEGKVNNASSGVGISGATINLGGSIQTTDAQGYFSFETELLPGSTSLIIQATGHVAITKTVNIPGAGASLYREYQLVSVTQAVTITATGGGKINQTSEEGTIETVIPAGAVTEDTQISVTPTLGSSSPVDVTTVVTAADEAPAQSVLLEPQNIQFAQPVEMKAPLSFPADYITGAVDVVRINPDTNQPETVGTAVVEGGKFKYNINQGGQYIVKSKTNLRHHVQTVREVVNVGSLGFNERPGTFRTFSFTEESTIEADAGFSENFIEGVYGFSDASRILNFSVIKDAGSNNAVTAYVIIEKVIHTYTTTSGRVVAKITTDNTGSESTYNGNYQAKWAASTTHGTTSTTFLGWWSPNLNRYLTTAEVNNLGLPNPPPQP